MVACKPGTELPALMREAGLEVVEPGIAGKLNPAAPFRLAALGRRYNSGLLHSHLSTAAWHCGWASRLLRIPSVAHVRALNTATAYRFATRCIAVSRAVKEHLVAQGIGADRIDVVYNGVDPDRYYLAMSGADARNRLGFPSGAVLVGVIAHLSRKKGHFEFLEALARASRKEPRLAAFLLGSGELQDEISERIAQPDLQGRVFVCPWQRDVLPYYAAADLIVLPSIAGEGLPRALLEGGLLERACIGTRLSGVPEIIRDRETGLIVEPGAVDQLAEALASLAGDEALRRRMGAASRDHVAATFTMAGMVAGVEAAYARAGARPLCG